MNILTSQIPVGWYDTANRTATALTRSEVRELDGKLRRARHLAWIHQDHYPLAPGLLEELDDLIDDARSAAEWADVALEPVGIVEIAGRLGVKRATVDQWRQRRVMPDPEWTVGGGPAWPWHVIEAWARDTGRLAATVAGLL